MPKKRLLERPAGTAPIRRRPAIASRYRLRLVREAVLPYGDNVSLHDSAETTRFLWTHLFRDEPREVLAAVFVNSKSHATGHMIAFTGTLDRTAAEPRHILSAALVANAAGVLVAHNHPSGDPTPSSEDLLFTERMGAACRIVGVRLVDHLILGASERWTSLLRKATW